MYGVVNGPDAVVGAGVVGTRPNGDAAVWVGLEGQVERVESAALEGDGHQEIRDIAWHDGQYVAVGCSDPTTGSVNVCEENVTSGQEATAWVSPDGREWSRLPPNAVEEGTNAAFWAITPTATGLVAVGHQQDAGPETRIAAFWFSADGQSWSRVPVEFSAETIESSATGVGANENGIVAVGYDDVGSSGGFEKDEAFWFSSDGTSWEQVAPTERRPANQVGVNVLGVPDGFIAVGRDFVSGTTFGAAWTSPDGRQWQRRYEDVLGADGAILRDIEASAGSLVIGGWGTTASSFGARIWVAPTEDP
jgi:hypothetical protein